MSTPASIDKETFETVRRCIAEALELEPEEIHWGDRLLADLGAESLDLLDMVFKLERAFGIQIPRGGLEARAKEVDGEPGEVEGRLTAAGAQRLREVMPEVPASEIIEGMKTSELAKTFRVGTFYNLIMALKEQKA